MIDRRDTEALDCAQVEQEQVAALYGESSERERELLASHLRGCLTCTAQGEELTRVRDLLGGEAENETAPGWLRARVNQRIRAANALVPAQLNWLAPSASALAHREATLVVASLSVLALFLGTFAMSLGEGTAVLLTLLPQTLPSTLPLPQTPAAWGLVNLLLGCAMGAFASLLAFPLLLDNQAGSAPFRTGEVL